MWFPCASKECPKTCSFHLGEYCEASSHMFSINVLASILLLLRSLMQVTILVHMRKYYEYVRNLEQLECFSYVHRPRTTVFYLMNHQMVGSGSFMQIRWDDHDLVCNNSLVNWNIRAYDFSQTSYAGVDFLVYSHTSCPKIADAWESHLE